MIIITGAAGFIGSVTAGYFNRKGFTKLVLVDDFDVDVKRANFHGKQYLELVERESFGSWFKQHATHIEFVIHLGARTDTTEFSKAIFDHLNLNYSIMVWKLCVQYQVPLIYASSAATYGAGEYGYSDNHELVDKLSPLNPYGISKNEFDKWALKQKDIPPFWAGLKFFNVYGPNEYHKLRMASVIFHSFTQIKMHAGVKLFRSHREDYADGEQLRDFIYVKDVVKVIYFLFQNQPESGLYNLGTGKARTFKDLAHATFEAMGMKPVITFIDTPVDIRDKYQYFTEAQMNKLRAAGYTEAFTSLEDGVQDYVSDYLLPEYYF